jgi:serine/threonine-protein kinase RsbT
MQEGYSTSTPEYKEMGFGAGMGLPNIKKNSDNFEIKTGKDGTHLKITFNIA